MEIIYISAGILCFSGFSFIVKKSQSDNCNIFALTASLYFAGFLLCIFKTIPVGSLFETPSILITLSIAAGIASVGSFLSHLASLHTGGKLALVYIISNMSTLIPIAYSMIFFNEKLSITKVAGIIMFIVFIFLLNNEMREKSV
ncbi:MAG: EamA family transporter [Clostridiaceae bacterium]|nr:EamA family transporter [Clostridiaceae bacterium]